MESIVTQAVLYDTYGPLLTEHQRHLYECKVNDNMSLAEIAEEVGISRQGVHDQLKKVDKALVEYEAKLHLVEEGQKTVDILNLIVSECDKKNGSCEKIRELAVLLLEDY